MHGAAFRRFGIPVGLVLTLLALCAAPGPLTAGPLQQQQHFDAPLLSANMCGAGAPDDVHFTIAATGDTFPHENIQAVGEQYGYDYLFDHLRPFLQAADLAYTNFDGAMLAGSPYTGYPNFNYNPQLASALKNAGIDVVSTANNHILDRGPVGLDATLAVFDQVGMLHHGAVSTVAANQPRPPYLPIMLSRDGVNLTIGFLSFTWGTNGIPDPYNQVNLLWHGNSYGQQGGIRPEVLAAIEQAARETDLVVVAAHWGFEYQFYPDQVQIDGAQAMAAAGADVILGAQPHTLQPVDIIDNNGRQTLVIYSLANFLASQGAFQAAYFSATAVVFYVGLVRHADGTVRVTGYRYLPTIHIDNDTRPAPIQPGSLPAVEAHVRAKLRDPHGALQVSADPQALGARVAVCPAYTLAEAPELRIGGDFAQHFVTLGSGTTPRPLHEALAVFGAPTSSVVQEPAGDCSTRTAVLYTERQRLELHPVQPWPYRVVGTPLGAAVYQQKYGGGEPERRTDLAGTAFADERFRAFFEQYGGLHVFGYPISGMLAEVDPASGRERQVQYFERARFELVGDAPLDGTLLDQVRLGLLSTEYAGIDAQCSAQQPLISATAVSAAGGDRAPQPAPAAPPTQQRSGSYLVLALMLVVGVTAWGVVYFGWIYPALNPPLARKRQQRRQQRKN